MVNHSTNFIFAVGLALVMISPAHAGPPGPGVSGPEADAAHRKVVDTYERINNGMREMDRARATWRMQSAGLQTKLAHAAATIDDCRSSHPTDFEVACRIPIAEHEAAKDDYRDGLVSAVADYEQRFTPIARAVDQRIDELVLEPRTYRWLLAQADKNGRDGDLLKFLLLASDRTNKLRARMSELVLKIYLADLVDGMREIEAELRLLDELTPEIGALIDAYDEESVPMDSLTTYAYPTPNL